MVLFLFAMVGGLFLFGEPQRGGRAGGAFYKLSTKPGVERRLGGRGDLDQQAWRAGSGKTGFGVRNVLLFSLRRTPQSVCSPS
jgi:hypothetical protein